MKTIKITEYRIVGADLTGIGWVAVQKWNGVEYKHISTFRSTSEAKKFIAHETV